MHGFKPAFSLIVSLALPLAMTSCGAGKAAPQARTPAAEAYGEPAPESADYEAAPSARADDDGDGDADMASAGADYSADEEEDSGDAEAEADMAPEPARPEPARRVASSPATGTAAGSPRGGTARVAADRPTMVARSGVKAGEWDDNANYREFQSYLATQRHHAVAAVDVRDRQFVVVRDSARKAVPGCAITVNDDQQNQVKLVTLSSGRALLFPHAEGLQGQNLTVTARCLGAVASQKLSLAQSPGAVYIDLPRARTAQKLRVVDIAFVLDSTGSMSEEIAAVKETIDSVARNLAQMGVTARIGLVEYKDRGDEYVTRVYPMTGDFAGFARDVAAVEASGGGDMPESVNEGLHVALDQLAWNGQAAARLAFLIGDAPPHLDYQQDTSYADSMRDASHRGIQVFTIAASGMDGMGQMIWRQIAQYTGGTNMFVLRGGAGPQSTGGGDPKSSCGGTQTDYASGNLDALIVGKIRQSIVAMDADPSRIPGLDRDEKAKPCSERIVIAE